MVTTSLIRTAVSNLALGAYEIQTKVSSLDAVLPILETGFVWSKLPNILRIFKIGLNKIGAKRFEEMVFSIRIRLISPKPSVA